MLLYAAQVHERESGVGEIREDVRASPTRFTSLVRIDQQDKRNREIRTNQIEHQDSGIVRGKETDRTDRSRWNGKTG